MRAALLSMTLGAVLLLSACGFQLAGRQALPQRLAVVHVEAQDLQSEFVIGLRRALVGSGARLVERPAEASAVVQVLSQQVSERVLSVSSRNVPREFEITYAVRCAVRANGEEILEPQLISLARDVSFGERAVLAKQNETAVLREAMARELVGLVMRQLATL
jgi:LPS-assembly lipoprotein